MLTGSRGGVPPNGCVNVSDSGETGCASGAWEACNDPDDSILDGAISYIFSSFPVFVKLSLGLFSIKKPIADCRERFFVGFIWTLIRFILVFSSWDFVEFSFEFPLELDFHCMPLDFPWIFIAH